MTLDKPLTAAELREALRLVAAELGALGNPPVVPGALDPDHEQAAERMRAYCATLGELDALVPDVAGVGGSWDQRWALGKLRERAAVRDGMTAVPPVTPRPGTWPDGRGEPDETTICNVIGEDGLECGQEFPDELAWQEHYEDEHAWEDEAAPADRERAAGQATKAGER